MYAIACDRADVYRGAVSRTLRLSEPRCHDGPGAISLVQLAKMPNPNLDSTRLSLCSSTRDRPPPPGHARQSAVPAPAVAFYATYAIRPAATGHQRGPAAAGAAAPAGSPAGTARKGESATRRHSDRGCLSSTAACAVLLLAFSAVPICLCGRDPCVRTSR